MTLGGEGEAHSGQTSAADVYHGHDGQTRPIRSGQPGCLSLSLCLSSLIAGSAFIKNAIQMNKKLLLVTLVKSLIPTAYDV